MADAVAKIVIKADNTEAISGAEKVDEAYKKASENIYKGFTTAGIGLTAFAGAGTLALSSFISAASEAESVQKMLEHAVIDVSHGTQEQVDALDELASSIQRNGVLDDDAIKRGQAQLSTFGLQTQSVYDLSQSMADLAVNQFGVTAGGAEVEQTANMIAKALQGQFGVLEKSGIRFSEAQQEMILYGTEAEKVAAIQEGFAQNLKFTNEVAAQTFEGAMANLENQYGAIQEALGTALLPTLMEFGKILGNIASKISELSPGTIEIIAKFLLFSVAVAAILGPALIFIGMIPTIAAGFATIGAAAAAAWVLITGPVGLVIAAIALVVAAGYLLVQNWDFIKEKALSIWGGIKDIFNSVMGEIVNIFNFIYGFFKTIWDAIKFVFDYTTALILGIILTVFGLVKEGIIAIFEEIKLFVEFIWDGMVSFITDTLNKMYEIFVNVLSLLGIDWESTWTRIKDFFGIIWNGIKDSFTVGLETLKTLWGDGLTLVKTTGDPILQWIKDGVGLLWDGFIGMFTDGASILSGAWGTMWSGLAGVARGVWNDVTAIVSESINWIINKINWLIKQANALTGKVGGPQLSAIKTISIPALAEGGIITKPTVALMGEAGPEAVVPLGKSGALGGGNIYNFNGPVSSKEVAMQYADLITREFGFSNKMV